MAWRSAVISGSTAVRCRNRWSKSRASPGANSGRRIPASPATSSTSRRRRPSRRRRRRCPVGTTSSNRRGTTSRPGASLAAVRQRQPHVEGAHLARRGRRRPGASRCWSRPAPGAACTCWPTAPGARRGTPRRARRARPRPGSRSARTACGASRPSTRRRWPAPTCAARRRGRRRRPRAARRAVPGAVVGLGPLSAGRRRRRATGRCRRRARAARSGGIRPGRGRTRRGEAVAEGLRGEVAGVHSGSAPVEAGRRRSAGGGPPAQSAAAASCGEGLVAGPTSSLLDLGPGLCPVGLGEQVDGVEQAPPLGACRRAARRRPVTGVGRSTGSAPPAPAPVAASAARSRSSPRRPVTHGAPRLLSEPADVP